MKVAIIGALNIEHRGGGEANAVMFANLLSNKGFQVKYFGSGLPVDNSPHQKIISVNFDYEASAFSYDIMANPFILRSSRLLSLGLIGLNNFRKTLKKIEGFDLYYFQNPTYLARKLIPLLIRQGSSVIIANHGTYFEYLCNSNYRLFRIIGKVATKFILDPLTAYGDKIIIHTQNSYQKSFYVNEGFPTKRIVEIPQHNINMYNYSINPTPNKFNVVFLGRLTESKGLDILPDIIKMNPSITFHIIGNGPLKSRLNDILKDKNAILYGYVDEEKKRKILSTCDAMIIPSHFESLSIAAIEGLSSGLPIIGSETASGLRYILSKDVIFGTLVSRNSKAFSDELEKIKNRKITEYESVRLERIRRRDRAVECFDGDSIASKMIEMVEKIIKPEKNFIHSSIEFTVVS